MTIYYADFVNGSDSNNGLGPREGVTGSFSTSGPAAVIDGRAAFVLARILASELRSRMTVKQLEREMRLPLREQAAVLAAEAALEGAGETWRLQAISRRRNGETGRSPVAAELLDDVVLVSSEEAAWRLGVTQRRVQQLVACGQLAADRSPGGAIVLRLGDVLAARAARGSSRDEQVGSPPAVDHGSASTDVVADGVGASSFPGAA